MPKTVVLAINIDGAPTANGATLALRAFTLKLTLEYMSALNTNLLKKRHNADVLPIGKAIPYTANRVRVGWRHTPAESVDCSPGDTHTTERRAKSFRQATEQALSCVSQPLRKNLTLDNGTEMVEHQKIAITLGLILFADPSPIHPSNAIPMSQ